MKYILPLLLLCMLAACGSNTPDSSDKDSVKTPPTDTLDRLFTIADEAELIDLFGKENVAFDTVYTVEGELKKATLLYRNTPDQVEIGWRDERNKKDLNKVVLTAYYNREKDILITKTRWKTYNGITLGTTLKEIEALNGRPFIFYGFGWDFGGIISEFNTGNLSTYPAEIQLGITDYIKQGNNRDYLNLSGDREFNSDDPEAVRLNPVVTSITIHELPPPVL